MKEVLGFHMNIAGRPTRLPLGCLVGILSLLGGVVWEANARDLVAPKEQSTTEIDPTQSPSFDEQKKGIPQSLFTWIKMAKGYDVEWDSFGRKGWYTQDPRLKPIEPTSVFTPDTPAIYIVFEVAPLEDPAQFSAQWFLEGAEGKLPDVPMGKDSLEVPGHERYGFLELKRARPQQESKGGKILFPAALGNGLTGAVPNAIVAAWFSEVLFDGLRKAHCA